jgi:hypothetical protein
VLRATGITAYLEAGGTIEKAFIYSDRNYCHYQISRGRRRRIPENFAE